MAARVFINYRRDDARDLAARLRDRLGLADKKTMRDFDVRCLAAVEELTAAEIAAMREDAGVSQAVFARVPNVSPDYVSKIERGTKRPGGSTLKLLSLMRHKGFEAIL